MTTTHEVGSGIYVVILILLVDLFSIDDCLAEPLLRRVVSDDEKENSCKYSVSPLFHLISAGAADCRLVSKMRAHTQVIVTIN